MSENCPICDSAAVFIGLDAIDSRSKISCSLCGSYTINETELIQLTNRNRKSPKEDSIKAILSHKVKWANIRNSTLNVDREFINEIFENPVLLRPLEQADRLILWFGLTLKSHSAPISFALKEIETVIGAVNAADALLVVDYLAANNIIQSPNYIDNFMYSRMTVEGWKRFDELDRKTDRTLAFMAMKFGRSKVAQAYSGFQQVATSLGFDLLTLDERQEAGIIHNRMKLNIQKSRFVVADLTYQNQGVFWEAGYAEGNGIPVIYTCEESHFGDIHFDLKPSLTIKWSLNENSDNYLPKALKELKATIVYTLGLDPYLFS